MSRTDIHASKNTGSPIRLPCSYSLLVLLLHRRHRHRFSPGTQPVKEIGKHK
jgi:hypothetical protein